MIGNYLTATYLNLLMRSNISSCETSGYFLRKRKASILADVNCKNKDRAEERVKGL